MNQDQNLRILSMTRKHYACARSCLGFISTECSTEMQEVREILAAHAALIDRIVALRQSIERANES